MWQSPMKSREQDLFIIFISIGSTVLLCSVFGYCGALHLKKRKFLKFFSVFLMLLCLAHVAVAAYRFVIQTRFHERERKRLKELFESEDEASERAFQKIEAEYKCCGIKSYNDYEEKFDPFLIGYPKSCCKNKNSLCKNPYKVGCLEKVVEKYVFEDMIRGIVMCVFACFKMASSILVWTISQNEFIE